jgi:hypothetical protein
MRITERKLRSIIKSVIKETYDDGDNDYDTDYDDSTRFEGYEQYDDEGNLLDPEVEGIDAEEEWVNDDEYSEETWDLDPNVDEYDSTNDGDGPWD